MGLYSLGAYEGYEGRKSSGCDFARSSLLLGSHPYPEKYIQTQMYVK